MGFTNVCAKKYAIVNVQSLNCLEEGVTVTSELLVKKGIVKKKEAGLRVLGHGKLEKKLTVQAHHFSESARTKIEKAGGSVEVLG
jgi:large subunit ribosomal protein L15